MNSPYSVARKSRDEARVNKVLGRKSGGRVDDGTNITITINGAGKEDQTAPEGPMPMPPPPMPMGPPPPMGGIGGPPPMGGPGPIGMAKGGRATGGLSAAARIAGPGRNVKKGYEKGGVVKKFVGGPMMGGRQIRPDLRTPYMGGGRGGADSSLAGTGLTGEGMGSMMGPQVQPQVMPGQSKGSMMGSPRLRCAKGGKVPCKDHGGSVKSTKPGPGIQIVTGGAGGGNGRLDKLRDQRAAK